MTLIRAFIIIIIVFNFTIFTIHLSADECNKQMTAILYFYDCLNKQSEPTAYDFLKLFGVDNEAELETISILRFPNEKTPFLNKEFIEYTKKLHENPNQYKSEFLSLVKKHLRKYFTDNIEITIAYPPKNQNNFKEFQVISNGTPFIFKFSQNDPYIEDMILPNGISIYSLIKEK